MKCCVFPVFVTLHCLLIILQNALILCIVFLPCTIVTFFLTIVQQCFCCCKRFLCLLISFLVKISFSLLEEEMEWTKVLFFFFCLFNSFLHTLAHTRTHTHTHTLTLSVSITKNPIVFLFFSSLMNYLIFVRKSRSQNKSQDN